MKIRYPPEPEEDETREDWERRALRPWRNEEKRRLLAERGWSCERKGCPRRAEHLDECLVPRCDMRGFSLEQRRLAFCSVNLALVCAEDNWTSHDREGAWERACARYGEQAVREWYVGLGLKSPRRDWT